MQPRLHATERQQACLTRQGADCLAQSSIACNLNALGPRLSDTTSEPTRFHVLAFHGKHLVRPRLSATPSGHVFRRAIWIEDVMFLVTAILPASEPLADTVVLELVDDVIDRHEGHVDNIHPHIEIRRHGINTSTPKRPKPFHSRNFRSSLRPPKLRSSKVEKALGHTQPHCADAYPLTLRVQCLDAVKHHARSNSMAK